MTGTFPPGVQAGIKKVSGTDGPPSTAQEAPAAGGGAQGDYAVTYTAQTGLIKYAPMQIPPGTKITAKVAKAKYPTSSVSIAKTFLPTPKQTTTMTASQTHSPANSRPFNVSEYIILHGKTVCTNLGSGTGSVNARTERYAKIPQQVERLIERLVAVSSARSFIGLSNQHVVCVAYRRRLTEGVMEERMVMVSRVEVEQILFVPSLSAKMTIRDIDNDIGV